MAASSKSKLLTWTKMSPEDRDRLCEIFVTHLGDLKCETSLTDFGNMVHKNAEVASRYKEATGSAWKMPGTVKPVFDSLVCYIANSDSTSSKQLKNLKKLVVGWWHPHCKGSSGTKRQRGEEVSLSAAAAGGGGAELDEEHEEEDGDDQKEEDDDKSEEQEAAGLGELFELYGVNADEQQSQAPMEALQVVADKLQTAATASDAAKKAAKEAKQAAKAAASDAASKAGAYQTLKNHEKLLLKAMPKVAAAPQKAVLDPQTAALLGGAAGAQPSAELASFLTGSEVPEAVLDWLVDNNVVSRDSTKVLAVKKMTVAEQKAVPGLSARVFSRLAQHKVLAVADQA